MCTHHCTQIYVVLANYVDGYWVSYGRRYVAFCCHLQKLVSNSDVQCYQSSFREKPRFSSQKNLEKPRLPKLILYIYIYCYNYRTAPQIVIVIVIVIVNLYSASSGEAPQRHSRPNKTKP